MSETPTFHAVRARRESFLPGRECLTRRRAQDTIKAMLAPHFRDERTKMSKAAQELAAEYMRLFVVEALQRGAKDASGGATVTVQPANVERVLPQLLLDF